MTELFRPKDVRAVAVDWNQTIVNTGHFHIKRNIAIAHEFGNEISVEDFLQMSSDTPIFPELARRLTGSTDMQAIMEVINRVYDNPDFAKREFAYAKTALQTIGCQGLGLGLLAEQTRETLNHDTESLGVNLGYLFDVIQTADDCEFKKTDGRIFDPMLKKLGVRANKLLYIGSGIYDCETALNAGTQFIGVTTDPTSAEELADYGAPYTDSLASVARLLSANTPRS